MTVYFNRDNVYNDQFGLLALCHRISKMHQLSTSTKIRETGTAVTTTSLLSIAGKMLARLLLNRLLYWFKKETIHF